MDLPPPVNHVFVDFENVHEIDPALIGQPAVNLMLLVGARQTKIDTDLVEKLMQHAGSVQLVRLTSTGRNALDFTLAYYVGRAVAADPTGHFHIISKDTGYDALVTHLQSRHVHAQRHGDYSRLTFSGDAKPTAPVRDNPAPPPAPAKAAAAPKPVKAPKAPAPVSDDRAGHVLEHLRSHGKSRPSREKTLVRHVISLFVKDKISEDEARNVIETLRQSGDIVVNDKGRVTYQLPATTA